MKITLNIMLDAVKGNKPITGSIETSNKISQISIFNPSKTDLVKDCLYVINLSDLIKFNPNQSNCYFIAVQDDFAPELKSISLNEYYNTIFIEEKTNIINVFDLLQTRFNAIYNWCEEMDNCLIRKKSIQDVLCLSEKIIGNFITITDSSFSLVAYTNGLECKCPQTNDLIKHGYYTQSAISKFNNNRLPEFWKDMNEIYTDKSLLLSSFVTISKIIHYNNAYFAHVIMLCDNKEPSKGLIDMFKILIDHLMVCFERQWVENHQMPHVYDSLIISLLEGNVPAKDAIKERAKISGIPSEANFRFIKISADGSGGVMLQRLSQELMDHIPEAKVTLSKTDMFVLLVQNPKHTDRSRQIFEMLQEILDHYRAKCGISERFTNIADLKLAGRQAEVALEYGYRCTYPYFTNNASKIFPRVYTFEGSYPRYLMISGEENEQLAKSCDAYRKLEQIYEHDKEHNSNNLELLYYYLTNDRKATETAAITHMHRNNVIYRIARLSEQLNVDFDNPATRLRFLLAYELFSI